MKSSLALAALAAAVLGLAAAPAAAALDDGSAGHGHMRRHHARAANIQNIQKRYQGHGTFYNTQTGNAGSCGRMLHNSEYVVAVAGGIMNSGLCGKTVTISANGKTAQATIEDTCPPGGGNCGGADLDMSPSLFAFFAPVSVGKMPISWSIGGGGGGNSGGGNDNSDDSGDDNGDDGAAAAAAAAARKAAAKAAAAAKEAAKEAAASASSESVASASSASVASESRASKASSASAARSSSLSEARASRSSAAAEASASRESVAAAAASAAAEAERPKVIENYVAVFEGMNNMVAAAQS